MRFTQDSMPDVNVIRGYAAGELRINDRIVRSTVIVSATAILDEPGLGAVTDLEDADIVQSLQSRLLPLKPEVILLGTGARQRFPPASLGATFLRTGIGFEVMDTGAACRTFNVLVAERRLVVAVLLV